MATLLDILSGVGNVLDVPGSMVRDSLMLQNPFDQIFSPASSIGRATSEDVLKAYKILNNKKSLFNTAMSLGADIALDPLTWVGGSLFKKSPSLIKSLSQKMK